VIEDQGGLAKKRRMNFFVEVHYYTTVNDLQAGKAKIYIANEERRREDKDAATTIQQPLHNSKWMFKPMKWKREEKDENSAKEDQQQGIETGKGVLGIGSRNQDQQQPGLVRKRSARRLSGPRGDFRVKHTT
jgi:hypothetical protein